MREKIGAMATAQSDAKAREAIAAVRQLRDVVRDGHAEVVARRAFRRALLDDPDTYQTVSYTHLTLPTKA